MRRALAAGMILFICISFSLWYSFYVTDTLSEIKSVLENDGDATELWRESRKMLSILLKHEELDQVDRELFSYEDYKRMGDKNLAHESAIRAAGIIECIINGERLKLENII